MKHHITILLGLALTSLFWSACNETNDVFPPQLPGVTDSTALLRDAMNDPRECVTCHPHHVQEWETSMHAYAMTDPVFFALNNIGLERSNNQLDQFCTKCHSPLGSMLGETPPGFDPGNLSSLAKKAIHCDVCHTMNIEISQPGTGAGGFHLDGIKRGPIEDPAPNAFHQSKFDNTYNFSDFCIPCHNVKSPDGSIDVEQTGTEWNNSPYAAMGLECQNCHMPSYSGQAAYNGPQRNNLHRHTFVGVDYPLVEFPGRQETIAAVQHLLENSVTMTVTAPSQVSPGSSFQVNVTVDNSLTGHDIPSGTIFERQMWVEILLKDEVFGTVYLSSGLLDDNGDLLNHHSEFVANGTLPPDTLLTLFNGTPIDKNGEESLFFWEAKSVVRNTIPAFQSRTAIYPVVAPAQPATLNLSVRLRFRSFPPYLLRAVGAESLLPALRIFDMETFQQTITVTN